MNYRGTIAYRTNSGGAMIHEGFAASFIQAWDFLNREWQHPQEYAEDVEKKREAFHFMRGQSCMPDESANQIAEQFLGDWVLMLDTDHVFAADAIYEMVTAFEGNNGAKPPLDVLVGFTQKRFPPYTPVLYKTDAFNAMLDFETIFPRGIDRHQLIPIDSSGAACLMVRREVFEKIKEKSERPFDRRRKFNAPHLSQTDHVVNRVACIPENRYPDETFGEDTSFFWRLQMLGIQAWCAPWIKFHHLTTVMVTEDMLILPPPKEIPQ